MTIAWARPCSCFARPGSGVGCIGVDPPAEVPQRLAALVHPLPTGRAVERPALVILVGLNGEYRRAGSAVHHVDRTPIAQRVPQLVRGLALVGLLLVVVDAGFRIAEMVAEDQGWVVHRHGVREPPGQLVIVAALLGPGRVELLGHPSRVTSG